MRNYKPNGGLPQQRISLARQVREAGGGVKGSNPEMRIFCFDDHFELKNERILSNLGSQAF
jgi:hypothetical protein